MALCPLGTMVLAGARPPGPLSAWPLSLPLSPPGFHSATWESSAHSSCSTAHAPQVPTPASAHQCPRSGCQELTSLSAGRQGAQRWCPKLGAPAAAQSWGHGCGRGAGLGSGHHAGRQLMSSLRCRAGPASPASHGAGRSARLLLKRQHPALTWDRVWGLSLTPAGRGSLSPCAPARQPATATRDVGTSSQRRPGPAPALQDRAAHPPWKGAP